MAIEKIKRRKAEDKLGFNVQLQAAKVEAQAAFDETGFADKAHKCCSAEDVAAVYEVWHALVAGSTGYGDRAAVVLDPIYTD